MIVEEVDQDQVEDLLSIQVEVTDVQAPRVVIVGEMIADLLLIVTRIMIVRRNVTMMILMTNQDVRGSESIHLIFSD